MTVSPLLIFGIIVLAIVLFVVFAWGNLQRQRIESARPGGGGGPAAGPIVLLVVIVALVALIGWLVSTLVAGVLVP